MGPIIRTIGISKTNWCRCKIILSFDGLPDDLTCTVLAGHCPPINASLCCVWWPNNHHF